MNGRYFKDTDTALLEFSTQTVDETKEISETVYADLDRDGNLVSMTIEHAAQLRPKGIVTTHAMTGTST